MSEKYNGWTNYETWCVNLWMSNDQGSDEHFREMAQEVYDHSKSDIDKVFSQEENATLTFRDQLKEEFEEQQSQLVGVTGVFSDLLGAALSEVNWYEIAKHYIEDVDKEETETA
jgi:hypothetical protein